MRSAWFTCSSFRTASVASAVVAVPPRSRGPQTACEGPSTADSIGSRGLLPGESVPQHAAPPRGSSPAGWRCPCPRCRAPSRGRARTRRARRRRARRSGACRCEPVSIAASSLRMSPNMFSVRITSKWRGAATSCIAALSTSRCSSSTFGNSSECTRVTTSRHSRLRLEHVRLVDAGDPRARGLEARCGRSARSRRRRTSQRSMAAVSRARLLAEVDPAGELAHDEQVGALDHLALERAGVVERGERPDGAQVGVQPEALAQAEQPLLGPRRVRVGRCPTSGRRPRRAARRRRAWQAASVSSVSAVPWASIDAPPNGCSSYVEVVRDGVAGPSSAEASTSGPIPSPGSVTMRGPWARQALSAADGHATRRAQRHRGVDACSRARRPG